MRGTTKKVGKPSRRRQIAIMVIGVIIGVIASMVVGGGIAAADNPKATPGPSIEGAANTNNLYEAGDGAIANATQLWRAQPGDLCKKFVQRSGHPYGSATIRVVDAGPNDRGVGAVVAKLSLSGLNDKGNYKVKLVKLSRSGNVVTGCPGTTNSTAFSVTSYDAPQATPVINQRFSVGSDGTQLYRFIITGPNGFLAQSNDMWIRHRDLAGSGH